MWYGSLLSMFSEVNKPQQVEDEVTSPHAMHVLQFVSTARNPLDETEQWSGLLRNALLLSSRIDGHEKEPAIVKVKLLFQAGLNRRVPHELAHECPIPGHWVVWRWNCITGDLSNLIRFRTPKKMKHTL